MPLMKIRLLAFATARQALNGGELELDVEVGCTVEDLAGHLRASYPDLDAIWPRLAIAVDGELVDAHTPLSEGSEVALLPPVSGGSGHDRAWLVDGEIDLPALADAAADPSCGAVLLFVGNVRDRHQDKEVARITYDAYRAMARSKLETIATDLEGSATNLRVRIVHRLGDVPVGQASVAIAVASPHRAAAYEASRKALERLKQEVPIWKQEHYTDGEVRWREEESLA
jgi:molybdopterin synthase catalytic subunit/molybdopterin converting factor small subunit